MIAERINGMETPGQTDDDDAVFLSLLVLSERTFLYTQRRDKMRNEKKICSTSVCMKE